MNDIEKIFDLLKKWYKFPKYQLERRVDIFFALYLPDILKKKRKNYVIDEEKKYDYIIPEFPLRKKDSYASNNADYAVFCKEKGPRVIPGPGRS